MEQKSHNYGSHHESLKEEVLAHFPYAIVSVAVSIILLSIITINGLDSGKAHKLFHVFHYLHLLFSGAGVILMFRKYSKSVIKAVFAGIVVPATFCTLSDSILPYIGGHYLGLHMRFHWCFKDHLTVVLTFLLFGIASGFAIGAHSESKKIFHSTGSHFFHILLSSMASILYFYSFGFQDWYSQIGFVFVYLVGAVLIPCSLADIAVPVVFARFKFNRKK